MSYCFLMRQPPNPSRTWSRFNQPYNFNNDFSEKELDERRKYEILKYGLKCFNRTNISYTEECFTNTTHLCPGTFSRPDMLYDRPHNFFDKKMFRFAQVFAINHLFSWFIIGIGKSAIVAKTTKLKNINAV